MEPEQVTITLGGKGFTVAALPIRDSKVWRARFVAEIKPLLDQLGELPGLKLDTAADIGKLLPAIERLLVGGVDQLIELLFAYAPALVAERDWIEGHATDKEAVSAFWEVLQLADPFGLLTKSGGRIGRPGTPTSAKSPSASGG